MVTEHVIPGYKINKLVQENPERTLLEATDEAAHKPVLLKIPKGKISPQEQRARYRREQSIIKRLNLKTMLAPLDIINNKGNPVMVFEHFGDGLLINHLDKSVFSIDDFLTIAVNLIKAVTELHAGSVTHSRLTPESILLNWKTKEVKLLDLETASMLNQDVPNFINFNELGNEIAYMAPEQSGRMNRTVDLRSNLYSIGCILYEMLTKRKVFESRSVVDLVYSHIAKYPDSPSKYNSGIPDIFDKIILKLLNKNAEDRYQSSPGLLVDLERCRDQYRDQKMIASFPLGKNDLNNQFSFPQKLYGREAEINKLLSIFEYVTTGHFGILMVAGYSGIGKTTLINEVHKSILSKGGYFMSGKYDQLERNNPYHALTSGLNDLIKFILSEPNSVSGGQVKKIISRLDGQGKLLLDVLPKLELLIGPQPDVPPLPIAESQNRFLDVLCRFIGAFASKQKPLTIFLDDLQWADLSTLKLLEKLSTYENNKNILFIGAYRDNEVSSTDPLLVTLSDIKDSGIHLRQINVKPLAQESINQLIADTLKTDPTNSSELSNIISKQTGSNPFFLKLFLSSLFDDGLLWFDSVESKWKWDINKIKAAEITSNVIDLMVQKLVKIPKESLELLKYAACMGNTFDLLELKHATDVAANVIAHHLWQPLSNDIIKPIDDSYKTAEEIVNEGYFINAKYKFSHDRIQQATYGLITEKRRKEMHLNIGTRLYANLSPEELESKLFNVVNHLNLSLTLINDNKTRQIVQKLNLRAAVKAKVAASFSKAAEYYSKACDLLTKDLWVSDEETTAGAYIDLAECEYICGKYENADKIYSLVLSKTKNPDLIARVYDIRLRQYAQQGRNKETLELGARILKTYGVVFKSEPSLAELAPILIMAKLSLLGKDPSKFTELPEIKDKNKAFALQTLMNISATAYVYDMNTMLFLVLRMLKISIKYGNAEESAFGYGLYGFVEGAALGNAKQARKFADLSIELCKKSTDPIVIAKVYFLRAFSTQHWFEPIRLAANPLKDAFKMLDQSGSYTFASYCLQATMAKRLYLGETLETYYRDIVEYSIYTEKVQEIYSQKLLFVLRRYVSKMTGTTHAHFIKDDAELEEGEFVRVLTEKRLLMPVAWYYVYEMMYHFHFGNSVQANEFLIKAKIVDDVAPTTMAQIEYHFYRILILSNQISGAPIHQKIKLKLKITSALRKLKKWSLGCAENYQSRYFLATAVYLAATSNHRDSVEHYFSQAHALTVQHNNSFLQGLVNELWAKYLFVVGAPEHALEKAMLSIANYDLNGARKKVTLLKGIYAIAVNEIADDTSSQKTADLSEIIDIEAILKSSRVISGEIVLDKLLSNLLTILIENVGGQRGFLILVHNDTLIVEVKKDMSSNDSEIMEAIPLEKSNSLSKMVVNYVWKTGESLLLDDASLSKQFESDPYLKANRVRSLLCVPIVNQGKTTAIMYIENNLAAAVFTEKRLHLTEMLTSQAAISIENAKLYYSLEQKVRDRTQQLSQEKKKSEKLLKNILPEEIIIELQKNGEASAKMFKNATILFSDFKDFTIICEKLNPSELVELIDLYFSSFDEIMKRHGIEKIKTVGDAYLAAGGLPVPGRGDTKAVVTAAFEMLNVCNKIIKERSVKNLPYFELRIGIHTGPVIAGVVGSLKFAYDIWGDAVNVAARMEQNGAPGKINVSGKVYELIKSDFDCTYRGKIKAKHKGEIDMYFVHN